MELKIFVIESGFVYIGNGEPYKCPLVGRSVKIKNCRNIRRYGTDKGLAQLANQGRQKETILDYEGIISVPVGKINHVMHMTKQAIETF